jgi:hypothetical protein
MGIYSDRNLYAGVNPHLNSFLQSDPENDWESFHSTHITHLMEALDATLPPGYACMAEKSLQITRVNDENESTRSRSKADVMIYSTSGMRSGTSPVMEMKSLPFAEMSLAELDDPDEALTGVVIYKITSTRRIPVTRLELLSPGNKPGGAHFEQYWHKRRESLRSEVNLVEVDYLHQFPPVVRHLPSYAHGDENAYPFMIIVSHPHPAYETGKARFFGSHVDVPLPGIQLPLLLEDTMPFDLNSIYDRTCVSNRIFRDAIDYSQLPLAFDRYSPADQERIRARMAAIAAEVAS